MNIGWRFPLNDNGAEDGLNHPGIETFLKSPIESLAREIIQNSRDAAKTSGKSVRVDFDLYEVPRQLFPDVDGFSQTLDRCLEYWPDNSKTQKFFSKAKAILEAENIYFLKISDYNTRGLTGSYKERGTDWYKLTKSVGASDKGGGQDGSFGIGKHAPYACSALRTVFYGTKDVEGNSAFQGVCKLVSHLNNDGFATQGTGFFGETNKLKPLHEFDLVDRFFDRKHHGTDVFIAGFEYFDDWEERIIRSVIENFFVAINAGELVVNVHGTRIDAESLEALIDTYFGHEVKGLTWQFYRALTEEKSYFFSDDDFQGLGRVELHIATGKELSKQVAMFRRSGMLVYRKKHFRTPLRFAGVFVARGEGLNSLLKSLEPPSHDDWQSARHEDPKYANGILRDLNSWISEKIREISPADEADDIDPEGVSSYLPDERDDAVGQGVPDEAEEGQERPMPIELQTRFAKTHGHELAAGETAGGNEATGTVEVGSSGENDLEDGAGSEAVPGGANEESGDSQVESSQSQNANARGGRLNLTQLRMFCSDAKTGAYRLSCVPEVSGSGHIAVDVVGEVGREVAPVLSVVDAMTGHALNVSHNGKIGPIMFESGKKIILSVVLSNKLRCALEVAAYAD